MESFFYNYEKSKLLIQHGEIINLLIFIILFLISALYFRKDNQASGFLNKIQTNQLKGLAILFVVVGHLWIHVSDHKIFLIFSGDAVALFLILSGYGLTLSVQDGLPDITLFFRKRLKRVMLPYWIITAIVLGLDYILLYRSYSLKDIGMTLLGINIVSSTQYIDYVRWYITFQLFWYFLFYISYTLSEKKGYMLLLFCAVLIFFTDYYITHFGWYQIFAFPIGCILGKYDKRIRASLFDNYKLLILLIIIISSYIILYKLCLKNYIQAYIPYIVVNLLNEISSILFCFVLIVFVGLIGLKGKYSSFLSFCGLISYELFLFHGPFLIKYNPLIRDAHTIPFYFMLFLGSVILISYIANRFLILIGGTDGKTKT